MLNLAFMALSGLFSVCLLHVLLLPCLPCSSYVFEDLGPPLLPSAAWCLHTLFPLLEPFFSLLVPGKFPCPFTTQLHHDFCKDAVFSNLFLDHSSHSIIYYS